MAFVQAWLMPRVVFWLIWTAWLWCLQSFLLARLEPLSSHLTLLFFVAPPVLAVCIMLASATTMILFFHFKPLSELVAEMPAAAKLAT